MTLEQKGALRAVIAAQVAFWDAQRAYEKIIGQEIKSFEAVSDYAVCAEDVTDAEIKEPATNGRGKRHGKTRTVTLHIKEAR